MITKILMCFAAVLARAGGGARCSRRDRKGGEQNLGGPRGGVLSRVRVRYQTHYPTRASMGHLTFSDIEVHMIGLDHAYVIGRWRLERTADGGGDTGGVYSLLFRRTPKGWKVILDHTS